MLPKLILLAGLAGAPVIEIGLDLGAAAERREPQGYRQNGNAEAIHYSRCQAQVMRSTKRSGVDVPDVFSI